MPLINAKKGYSEYRVSEWQQKEVPITKGLTQNKSNTQKSVSHGTRSPEMAFLMSVQSLKNRNV